MGLLRTGAAAARSYKTASGELVEDQGEAVLRGAGEDGGLRSMKGRVVSVHKALISASAVRQKGNHIYIGPDGSGAIVPKGHAAGKLLDRAVRMMEKKPKGCVWLYEEGGVYNFYLKCGSPTRAKAQDISAQDAEMEETAASAELPAAAAATAAGSSAPSGGRRLAQP